MDQWQPDPNSQDPLDPEEQALMDPESWSWDESTELPAVEHPVVVLSLSLSFKEHDALARAARHARVPTNEFIKRVALHAASESNSNRPVHQTSTNPRP